MTKKEIGIAILRYGFVFVFLWFGSMQIMKTGMWTSLIPAWVVSISGLSASTIVVLNGIAEIIGALLLALNIWVPLIATLLSLHLVGIVFDLGISAIGVRDIGLASSILALAFLSAKE